MNSGEHKFVADYGLIRDRQAVIGLTEVEPGLCLQVKIAGEGRLPETSINLPLAPYKGTMPADWPPHILAAELPGGTVVSAVPIIEKDGSHIPVEIGSHYVLHVLLPKDKAALSKYMFHRRSRIADTETLVFMLRQILNSGRHSPLHKLEAVKILAYRALESLEPEQLTSVYELVDRGFEETAKYRYEVAVAQGVVFQESRYQATVSLRTVRWYTSMLLGKFDQAFEDAEWLMASLPQAYQCPTISYNCAITVLAYGQIFRMAGDTAKAVAAFDAVVGFFRAAAAEMPSQPPATFREVTVPFQAALAASEGVRHMSGKSTKGDPDVTPTRIAEDFSRFRTKGSRQAYAAAMEAAATFLAAKQKAAFIAESV